MKNWIATLLFTAGLLGVATQLSARPGFGCGPMDSLERIQRMAQRLDLSTEQEQEITELIDAAQVANAVDRERLPGIHDELRTLTNAFDEGAAQTLADELGQVSGRLAYSQVSTVAGILAVLTAEQQQQIEKFRARHEEFRHHFGDHKREMPGGG